MSWLQGAVVQEPVHVHSRDHLSLAAVAVLLAMLRLALALLLVVVSQADLARQLPATPAVARRSPASLSPLRFLRLPPRLRLQLLRLLGVQMAQVVAADRLRRLVRLARRSSSASPLAMMAPASAAVAAATAAAAAPAAALLLQEAPALAVQEQRHLRLHLRPCPSRLLWRLLFSTMRTA